MPRIVGVDIPREKRIDIALRYVYGVGASLAREALQKAQVAPATRAKDLTDEEMARLNAIIAREYKVEGDLRREVSQDIRRLMEIGSYRGIRHKRGLPTRGQRTSSNARTRKGRRAAVGVKRMPVAGTGRTKGATGGTG